MNGRTVLPVFALGKRRRAFALGEALILIIVVLVTLGGIFSSIDYAVLLRERAQADLDGYMIAQAWFEALESEKPENIENQSMLNVKALEAAKRLGGRALGKDRFAVRAVVLIPEFGGTLNGARRVDLTVSKPQDKGTFLRFSRSFNTHSSNTVQDNASKRQPQS